MLHCHASGSGIITYFDLFSFCLPLYYFCYVALGEENGIYRMKLDMYISFNFNTNRHIYRIVCNECKIFSLTI